MSKKIDTQKIVSLFNNKVSVSQICKELKYSKTTVIKHLKESGVYELRFPFVDSNKILELHHEGKSVKEIAKLLNISQNSVLNHLHKHNVVFNNNALSIDDIQEAIKLYNEGWLLMDIATSFNCSTDTISKYLKSNGVKINNHTILGTVNQQEIVNFFNIHRSLIKTAQHFNRTQFAIKTILMANGINLFGKRWNPELDAELITLYKNGLSAEAVGNILGYSHKTILRRLKRLGERVRKRYVEAKRTCSSKNVHKSLFYRIKQGAIERDLEISITIEDIELLFKKQKGKCALSGVDITLPDKYIDLKNGLTTASLDRIDSSRGYTIDNIQWVHKSLNRMKLDMPNEIFIDWCKTIAEYQK